MTNNFLQRPQRDNFLDTFDGKKQPQHILEIKAQLSNRNLHKKTTSQASKTDKPGETSKGNKNHSFIEEEEKKGENAWKWFMPFHGLWYAAVEADDSI